MKKNAMLAILMLLPYCILAKPPKSPFGPNIYI
ncbi:Uncharacterised protein [Legionella beliardensis]|uniref:Uncharacterized protein n=1 Tax=Legionella beliardensis TaxID=91822 RepID=A0A378I092_9GAMM|nr:Uncharacterised protein [Legionella beliardensis]